MRGTDSIAAIHLIRDSEYIYKAEPGSHEAEFEFIARKAWVISLSRAWPLKVDGVLVARDKGSHAIIDGRVFQEGDFFGKAEVIQIQEIVRDRVTFRSRITLPSGEQADWRWSLPIGGSE